MIFTTNKSLKAWGSRAPRRRPRRGLRGSRRETPRCSHGQHVRPSAAQAIDRDALPVQNERARSEPPRPRKGPRPRPRSIRTPRSIVLFQPGADAGTRKGIRMPGTSDPYAAFRLNFEQQRKRAKDLLRAVRAGDSAARRRLADALAPRAPDAAALKLTDVQFAIARELGFGSWRDLRAHVMAQTAARETIAQRGP